VRFTIQYTAGHRCNLANNIGGGGTTSAMVLGILYSSHVKKRDKVVLDQSVHTAVVYPGILLGGGGGQQIQLRTEGRKNRDLGAVAPPSQGFNSICK
jgi:hypothetical protein